MVNALQRALSATVTALAAPCAVAQTAADAPGLGSVLQVSAGLGVVLAMVAGAAWLVRRLGVAPAKSGGLLKICGSVAVGQRERVLVLEIRDVWLVIGVAPGHVNTLHVLSPPEGTAGAAAPQESARAFSAWLRRALERNHA